MYLGLLQYICAIALFFVNFVVYLCLKKAKKNGFIAEAAGYKEIEINIFFESLHVRIPI